MSDGVHIRIPGNRTIDGEDRNYYLSTDEAAQIAAHLIDGIADEYITGTEDLEHNHETRRAMRKQARMEVKDKLYGPYGHM